MSIQQMKEQERESEYVTFRIKYSQALGQWLSHIDELVDWFEVPPMPVTVIDGIHYLVIDENDLGCLVSFSRDDLLLNEALGVSTGDARRITGLDVVEEVSR